MTIPRNTPALDSVIREEAERLSHAFWADCRDYNPDIGAFGAMGLGYRMTIICAFDRALRDLSRPASRDWAVSMARQRTPYRWDDLRDSPEALCAALVEVFS